MRPLRRARERDRAAWDRLFYLYRPLVLFWCIQSGVRSEDVDDVAQEVFRELAACLRTGRVLRTPRARTRGRGKTFISPDLMISKRPAEAADRAVPGH